MTSRTASSRSGSNPTATTCTGTASGEDKGRDGEVDVSIVGAGPVGLLLAYQLARLGNSVCVVDRDDKFSPAHYGRANVLYSRSAEFLDQLDLADEIVQACHVCRESYTYDRDGRPVVPGRVWNFVENVDDTVFDFAIMLRQQFIEGIIRGRLEKLGIKLQCPVECVGFHIEEDPGRYQYPISSIFSNMQTKEQYIVKSKYLIGADGGRSFVRTHLGIKFVGDSTENKWIRIDGKLKSDLPHPRAYASIESPTHGNVLWAPLDKGITRIGYTYTKENEEKYNGQVTEEIAKKEAIAAVAPFNIEYERVEWFTLYSIAQRVAETFQYADRIFLAGDACHTHSSGAAQGLNTGVHDAVNLGWKLSLVLNNHADPKLLKTYTLERKAAAERLINFDKEISSLMSNKLPDSFGASPDMDINEALAQAFNDASGYNTGLKLSYTENRLNVMPEGTSVALHTLPGTRAPDAPLLKPGTNEPIRLQQITPNLAKFHVLVFAGNPRATLSQLKSISEFIASKASFTNCFPPAALSVITIAASRHDAGISDGLGILPFSPTYIDDRRKAHIRYGIDVKLGALIVVRPDGFVGTVAPLSAEGGGQVVRYLSAILKRIENPGVSSNNITARL